MSKMKEDGLLSADATQKDFEDILKDTVGKKAAKSCEGYLIPKPGRTDTLDFFDI